MKTADAVMTNRSVNPAAKKCIRYVLLNLFTILGRLLGQD